MRVKELKHGGFCMHHLLWRENYSAVFSTHCILFGSWKVQQLFLDRVLTGLCNEHYNILRSNAL